MPPKPEAHVSEHDRRIAQHDREIAAIRKLVLQGMKMLAENQAQIKALALAQLQTEKTLDRFIRSLERGNANGHHRTDIQ